MDIYLNELVQHLMDTISFPIWCTQRFYYFGLNMKVQETFLLLSCTKSNYRTSNYCVSKKLRTWGKSATYSICVGHYLQFKKQLLQKMIKGIIFCIHLFAK